MYDVSGLGIRIRQLRIDRGFTQDTFARDLGVSPQAVSKWETGAGCPDIGMLPLIANTLEVSIDALFGEINPLIDVPLPEPELPVYQEKVNEEAAPVIEEAEETGAVFEEVDEANAVFEEAVEFAAREVERVAREAERRTREAERTAQESAREKQYGSENPGGNERNRPVRVVHRFGRTICYSDMEPAAITGKYIIFEDGSTVNLENKSIINLGKGVIRLEDPEEQRRQSHGPHQGSQQSHNPHQEDHQAHNPHQEGHSHQEGQHDSHHSQNHHERGRHRRGGSSVDRFGDFISRQVDAALKGMDVSLDDLGKNLDDLGERISSQIEKAFNASASYGHGSQNAAQQHWGGEDIRSLNINVSGNVNTYIHTGAPGKWNVVASGRPEFLSRLEVVEDGDTLNITMPNHSGPGNWKKNTIHIYTGFELGEYLDAKIAGSGNIECEPSFETSNVGISGSGDIELLNAGTLSCTIRGSGDISFVSGKNATIAISGSGDIKGVMLEGINELRISGSGNADVQNVVGDLHCFISGSGDITVQDVTLGTLKASASGSGDISIENGRVENLEIELRGASDFSADTLVVGNLKATLSGASDASIGQVTGHSEENVSRTSDLKIRRRGQ